MHKLRIIITNYTFQTCSHKHSIFIYLVGTFILLYMVYLLPNTILKQSIDNFTLIKSSASENGYLIYTPKCMIPNLDPWNDEIRPFYKKKPYVSCSKYNLLTYVIKNETNAILRIDKEAAKLYSTKPITCCYQYVIRDVKTKVPDDNIKITRCIDFQDELDITDRIVIVKCRANDNVYSNCHAPVTINEKVRQKMAAHENLTKTATDVKPLNIILIGIDSMSRLNFIRTMPKTRKFLLETGWIEYTGYNKVGDNTFPNLMAALTGKKDSEPYEVCTPTISGKLDECNFIWKEFSNLGYVTAYAEDEAIINTFNYHKKGFVRQPTDYYFRPYTLAVNQLEKKAIDEFIHCTGAEMPGQRILNVAKDFAYTFISYPYFGFFWMNSFSHNNLNSPTRMDVNVLQFFEDLQDAGTFNNTMIIFLSDHGLRVGKVRMTNSGWLEERLPFIYFWIPKWFKDKYPKEYSNLKTNAISQLTTPYDLYMTLQDTLKLSGFNYTIKPSQGCPRCVSFFSEIHPRSCGEVNIDAHWCTCFRYKNVSITSELVKKSSEFIVQQVNDKVNSYGKLRKKCAKFAVSKVITASMSIKTPNMNDINLIIIVETVPKAVFEGTVSVVNGNVKNGSIVSRLNSYREHSYCVEDSILKKYCYCK